MVICNCCSRRWWIFNWILALKNSSSKNSDRWRFNKCYAHEHIMADFPSIFKSFNVWISFKKTIFMRVIRWWIVVITFKNRRDFTLRFNYITIMIKNWHIVQWFTYCAVQQTKRAIGWMNNYSLNSINKFTTLCKT